MALRGIQEYIAKDVNDIARVEDEGNIVSIEGNIIARTIIISLPSLSQSAWILCWPPKALYG